MVNVPRHSKLHPVLGWISHGAIALSLAVAGISLGMVPQVSLESGLRWESTAYAQSISVRELENYARSVMEIEPIRQDAVARIANIVGAHNVPAIACHQPQSLNRLDEEIRQIARNYCDRSIAIVERNDLTIERFNQITVMQERDRDLRSQIQQILRDLP